MNNIDANDLLKQMHELASTASNSTNALSNSNLTQEQNIKFSALLGDAINHVNQIQSEASNLAKKYEMGDTSVDLSEVMISLQKSNVTFQALTQVRNKLVLLKIRMITLF